MTRGLRLPLWLWLVILTTALGIFIVVFLSGWLSINASPQFEVSESLPAISERFDGSGFRDPASDGLPFSVPTGYKVIPYEQVLSCGKSVRYYVVVPDGRFLEPCGGSGLSR